MDFHQYDESEQVFQEYYKRNMFCPKKKEPSQRFQLEFGCVFLLSWTIIG